MMERIVFEYLVNVLWQLPLLLLGVWLLVRIARPPLLAQHLLWLTTLAVAVALPMRGVTPHSDRLPSVASALAPAAYASPVHEPEFIPIPVNNITTDVHALDTPSALPAPAPPPSHYFAMHTGNITVSPRFVRWAVRVYIFLVALCALRLLISVNAALRIRARGIAQPLTLLESSLLITCARRIDLPSTRLPLVRSLASAASPMVIGIRNPVLLLPESLRHKSDTFNERDLIAVLTHELAHIRRRDYLVNLIARVVSLPIGWHPAAMAIAGRIRQTREMICDAEAAGIFDASTTYARSLLTLAGSIIQPHPNVEAVGLFNANRRTLEERIMKLTETQSPMTPGIRIARIAAGTAILTAAITAGAMLHLKPSAPAVYAAQQAAQEAKPQEASQPATQPSTGQSVPPAEAVSVQAPTIAPAPAPTPAPAAAPAPEPKPKPAPRIYRDGQMREMTPEEREKFDKQIDQMHADIRKAMSQLDTAKLQQQIATANLKALNSADIQKQLDVVRENLKAFNSPEFRERLAHLDTAEIAKQMDELKQRMNTPEFREQMKVKAPLIVLPDLSSLDQMGRPDPAYKSRILEARSKLHEQIKEANTDPVLIQKAVDEFVKTVNDATSELVKEKTPPAPPAPPKPPTSL